VSQAATQVNIISPLTGIMVPIGDVPDPVFAKKMVGDGFSIDPLSNTLLAPIDGQIADLQAARHALTIRSADGLEVLIHIGLETVALGGKGFTAHVAPGDAVKTGDELITFDIDQVACDAKSLLTQVVITNGELVESITPAHGLKHAGEDVAATVVLKKAVGQAEQGGGEGATVTSEAVALPNPTGMHARPAATLVALAKKYSSNVKLVSGDMSANAKSIVAIMGLGLAHGQDVAISATGADARTAAADLIQAIKDGLGEEAEPVAVAPAPEPPAAPKPDPAKPAAPPRSGDPNTLLGISASPGLAAGTVVQLRTQEFTIAELGQNAADERRTLRDAVDRAMWSLGELRDGLEKEGNSEKAGIFGAHQEILQDPELLERADAEIDGGKSAAFAWRKAYTDLAEQLASLDNEVLAGRATDVRDVGTRVLGEITGQLVEKPDLNENTILVAKELTPSDTAQIDRAKVIGFATVNGGVSSHVAIIARSMDIPALVGIEERALDIADGTRAGLHVPSGQQGVDEGGHARGGAPAGGLNDLARGTGHRAGDVGLLEHRDVIPGVAHGGHLTDLHALVGQQLGEPAQAHPLGLACGRDVHEAGRTGAADAVHRLLQAAGQRRGGPNVGDVQRHGGHSQARNLRQGRRGEAVRGRALVGGQADRVVQHVVALEG